MQQPEPRAKIMIVDDDPVVLTLLEDMLKAAGYDAKGFPTGETALETVGQYKPDVILLDYRMPRSMSGISVCQKLKKNGETQNIPVIFVTAITRDEVLEEAFEAGAADYVRKPVSQVELFARVKSALNHVALLQQTAIQERIKGVMETTGAVCHEMNQPLQLISGYSEMLTQEAPPDTPLAQMAAEIVENARKLGEITRKLMNITRYETREYLDGRRILDINKSSGEAS